MKCNTIHLVWISRTPRRKLLVPDLQDLVYQQWCQDHGRYTDDKLMALRLKSPATRLTALFSTTCSVWWWKPPKVRITDPVCIINLMKCPLTKGHYYGNLIQVMTSSWCQLILGKIWKPAVRSRRLAVMKMTKHRYIVSLCKASTFSIVLNVYEPWAKGTNFEIHIPEITGRIDHESFYHCNEWVLIGSTHYANIEARVAMI